MQDSLLIKVIQQLSKRDVREIRKLIQSPYFNQRTDLLPLFNYLVDTKAAPPEYHSPQQLFEIAYPQETFHLPRLRHLMTYLLNAIKSYFAIEEARSEQVDWQLSLVRALRKRKLNKLYQQEFSKLQQLQERQQLRNTQYHFRNYLLHKENYEYTFRSSRSRDIPLQQLTDELSTFYVADILHQSCSILTHKTVWKKDYDIQMLEAVLQKVDQGYYLDSPSVAIYYHSYRALSDLDTVHHFEQLKILITEHWQQFPPGETRDIYQLAINYCIRQLNRGEQQFIREAFELYRSGLEKKVLLEDGLLAGLNYKNILRLGIALKEYEWAEQFLERYKPLLPKAERENTYRYNMAYYHFQKREYEQTMQLLQEVEFRDVFNNLDARRMLLRIYFELGEYNALESLLDSFKTYISRLKGIGYHKENYLNLIRFVRRMLRGNLRQPAFREQLKVEVQQTQALAERDWLLDQLALT